MRPGLSWNFDKVKGLKGVKELKGVKGFNGLKTGAAAPVDVPEPGLAVLPAGGQLDAPRVAAPVAFHAKFAPSPIQSAF